MIRAGKQYRRRIRPHTTVTVIHRGQGLVTYQLKKTVLTISVRSFKDIYEKAGRCRNRK